VPYGAAAFVLGIAYWCLTVNRTNASFTAGTAEEEESLAGAGDGDPQTARNKLHSINNLSRRCSR
jgi:hypothetical protein